MKKTTNYEKAEIFAAKIVFSPENVSINWFRTGSKGHVSYADMKTTLCGRPINRFTLLYNAKRFTSISEIYDYWNRFNSWQTCYYCKQIMKWAEYRLNELKSEGSEHAEAARSSQ